MWWMGWCPYCTPTPTPPPQKRKRKRKNVVSKRPPVVVAANFLVKWIPIKVTHIQKYTNFECFITRNGNWLHPIVMTFNTLKPSGISHPMVWGASVDSMVLNYWFVLALVLNFLEKLTHLVALQFFQSSYLSCEKSLNHNIWWHYY